MRSLSWMPAAVLAVLVALVAVLGARQAQAQAQGEGQKKEQPAPLIELTPWTEDPEAVLVDCTLSTGPITVAVRPKWAPLGAQRFLELVDDGFYTDIGLFRCVKNFLVQFGISDDKAKNRKWNHNIKDDPNLHIPVKRGFLSYAGGGPNTRTTQIFIAFKDLGFLGKAPWETCFGHVVEGMDNVDKLYTGYGDGPPFGKGPAQGKIHNRGNEYLKTEFPELSYLKECHRRDAPGLRRRPGTVPEGGGAAAAPIAAGAAAVPPARHAEHEQAAAQQNAAAGAAPADPPVHADEQEPEFGAGHDEHPRERLHREEDARELDHFEHHEDAHSGPGNGEPAVISHAAQAGEHAPAAAADAAGAVVGKPELHRDSLLQHYAVPMPDVVEVVSAHEIASLVVACVLFLLGAICYQRINRQTTKTRMSK